MKNQLTKVEACQLYNALSHLPVREGSTELLTALLKLRAICGVQYTHNCGVRDTHNVTVHCPAHDSRVNAIKIIRQFLGIGLKEAKDMLDLVTCKTDSNQFIHAGTVEFTATPAQIESFKANFNNYRCGCTITIDGMVV